MTRLSQVDLDSPDPTDAINAFFWNMNKARALGFTPPIRWTLAEHFLRNDASLVFYGPGGGTMVLDADDMALTHEDSWEFVKFLIERVTERRKAKLADAPSGEIEEAPVKEEAVRSLPLMSRQRGGLTRASQKVDAQ